MHFTNQTRNIILKIVFWSFTYYFLHLNMPFPNVASVLLIIKLNMASDQFSPGSPNMQISLMNTKRPITWTRLYFVGFFNWNYCYQVEIAELFLIYPSENEGNFSLGHAANKNLNNIKTTNFTHIFTYMVPQMQHNFNLLIFKWMQMKVARFSSTSI